MLIKYNMNKINNQQRQAKFYFKIKKHYFLYKTKLFYVNIINNHEKKDICYFGNSFNIITWHILVYFIKQPKV